MTTQVSTTSSIPCLHCGLGVPRNHSSQFCCGGCRTAYELIHHLGLTYFYRLRDSADGDLCAVANEAHVYHFSHFDDPEFAATFVRTEADGSKSVSFYIDSLHCSACVWLLEQLPLCENGISRVRVDLTASKVWVLFEENAKLSEIGATLAQLGYYPHPIAVDPGKRTQQKGDGVFTMQLAVAAFCSMNVMLLFVGRYEGLYSGMEQDYATFFAWVSLMLAIPAVTFSALPFYRTSLAGLRMGRLHIDLPIAIAIVGGFAASAVNTFLGRSEIYFDTVTALVFLLLVGRWFQRRGLKHVASVSDMLFSIAPIAAARISKDGNRTKVFVESLHEGDVLVVAKGERIPADGVLLSEQACVNNALLTGESSPSQIGMGSEVFYGTVNIGPEFLMSVTNAGEQSRLGNLVRGIQTAPVRESSISQFTDRIAKYFVGGVLVTAAATFLTVAQTDIWSALDRVFALLIVSCPCALGIATPIVLSLASAKAGRLGLLLQRGSVLEEASTISEVYFDKTGTLTEGQLSVEKMWVLTTSYEREQILQFVAALESRSDHPTGLTLKRYAEDLIQSESCPALDELVIEPTGVSAKNKSGKLLRLGSFHWLRELGVADRRTEAALRAHWDGIFSLVGLAEGDELLAAFAVGDKIRPEAQLVIRELSRRGIKSSIVSGDSLSVVQDVAQEIGIPLERTQAEQNPEQKASFTSSHRHTMFVGDGVNDAFALSKASIGVGIKGGAEICLKVSDVFLLKPDLRLLIELVDGSKQTVQLIRRHLFVSLVYNITAASLAVVGFIGPLAAALIMPASSMSVIAISFWKSPFRGSREWK